MTSTTPNSVPNIINDLPVAIESPYLPATSCEFPQLNAPIILYSGTAELRTATKTINGVVKVRMDWFPSTGIFFEFRFSETWDLTIGGAILFLKERNVVLDVYVTSFNLGGVGVLADGAVKNETVHHNSILTGIVKPILIGASDNLVSKITFLIPNFFARNGKMIRSADSTCAWGGRLIYAFGEWEITLDRIKGCDSEFFKNLAKVGGYSITHIGMARRFDGKSFGVDKAQFLREAMNSLISFCYGRRTGILLPVGFNNDNEKIWELWDVIDICAHVARIVGYRIRVQSGLRALRKYFPSLRNVGRIPIARIR